MKLDRHCLVREDVESEEGQALYGQGGCRE